MIANAIRYALEIVLMAFGVAAPPLPAVVAQPPDTLFETTLQEELQAFVSEFEATYGIAAVNLENGRTVYLNADAVFPTASMYKLLVMYRVFQAMENGEISADQAVMVPESDPELEEFVDLPSGCSLTVEEALEAMITVSSNSAAYALTNVAGGWGAIASAAQELGMDSTVVDGEEWYSTPEDIALFFRMLAARSLVSASASEGMINLLLRQRINDRIPALLPEGVEVAHKTGELAGVRVDGGIVLAPNGSFVLVTMSQGGDPEEETRAEAEISRLVFERFAE